MFGNRYSFESVTQMGCCGCFRLAYSKTPKMLAKPKARMENHASQECLLDEELEDEDDSSQNGDGSDTGHGVNGELRSPTKCSEGILTYRTQRGLICREFPVKETHRLIRSEDENGNKMINEYVREFKIGSGSYGKVVLYRSTVNGKHYAIKAFHKTHLSRLRVAPSETAMTDVLREVLIMKILEHPNIVNLIEVIDDPTTDNFYMVLEYVEGKWVFEGSGPIGGLGEIKAQKYLRDIVSGLMYLHAHNIVHGDIKPDNLLVTAAGTVKIGDFSVSQLFEDGNDELRRSPGTPVFTAPECCLGLTYHGKAADTWAVGVTLYCMVFGKYPFLGDTLQDTYDKIANHPLSLPDHMNPLLKNLLEGLLCKDPIHRMTLEAVADHAWVLGEGPVPQYLCWCKRKKLQTEISNRE
ncbi:serine/threonine-protein kinase GRIK1-like isoform X2 [Rhododendron vialii]|uniref:serine/threonine-protein kinase GRIK1-like isoform X2 n=1 Tax=Rhododendron vialii TaxID=182163 RepID=UPI00265EC14A|nr:serine/threonine-protein kinase GRIK1-like isoform X2 [Rhododendron vialii]